MEIRTANQKDIDNMVRLDRECFGNYGAKKDYFINKINNAKERVLVSYDSFGKIIGFIVFETLEKNMMPENFCDLKIKFSINSRWIHIAAFTTVDKYADKKICSELLSSAEKIAKNIGCTESYVPLSKKHPFKENGVFEFWKSSGYKNVGEIKWKAGPNEFIECFFYRKTL